MQILNIQINITIKNLNWREADQLAIYKRSREVELGLPRTTSASGQNGIWTRGLRISKPVRRSNHSTTRPRWWGYGAKNHTSIPNNIYKGTLNVKSSRANLNAHKAERY